MAEPDPTKDFAKKATPEAAPEPIVPLTADKLNPEDTPMCDAFMFMLLGENGNNLG